jgi:hypothetical protein
MGILLNTIYFQFYGLVEDLEELNLCEIDNN